MCSINCIVFASSSACVNAIQAESSFCVLLVKYKGAQHSPGHTIPCKPMPKQYQAPRNGKATHAIIEKHWSAKMQNHKQKQNNLCYTFTHIFPNLADVGGGERFFAASAPDTPECSHKRKRDNATRCENKCWDLRMLDTAESSFWGAAKEGWPRNPPPNDMVVHR